MEAQYEPSTRALLEELAERASKTTVSVDRGADPEEVQSIAEFGELMTRSLGALPEDFLDGTEP